MREGQYVDCKSEKGPHLSNECDCCCGALLIKSARSRNLVAVYMTRDQFALNATTEHRYATFTISLLKSMHCIVWAHESSRNSGGAYDVPLVSRKLVSQKLY